jgi:uronate dehydrogenase
MSKRKTILLTGAAGVLGRWLRPRLLERYDLRSADRVDPSPAHNTGETLIQADMADLGAVERMVAGVDGVIHFGGRSIEDEWEEILHSNIIGCYNMFEAARRQGVKRLVFASSNHAIGYHRSSERLDVGSTIRPDTRYGVSKAFGEAVGSYYADKFGLEVACLRIGSALAKPTTRRHLATWLSYPDLERLVVACLEAPQLHFAVVYGASANTRGWWDNSGAPEIDYKPQDNAEDYAAEILAKDPDDPVVFFQGGPFVADTVKRKD